MWTPLAVLSLLVAGAAANVRYTGSFVHLDHAYQETYQDSSDIITNVVLQVFTKLLERTLPYDGVRATIDSLAPESDGLNTRVTFSVDMPFSFGTNFMQQKIGREAYELGQNLNRIRVERVSAKQLIAPVKKTKTTENQRVKRAASNQNKEEEGGPRQRFRGTFVHRGHRWRSEYNDHSHQFTRDAMQVYHLLITGTTMRGGGVVQIHNLSDYYNDVQVEFEFVAAPPSGQVTPARVAEALGIFCGMFGQRFSFYDIEELPL